MDWDEVIAHVAISTGWTLDHVRWNLDLPSLKSLTKYWRKFPPLHVLAAAYVGYKEPAEVSSGHVVKDEISFEQFMANVPQRVFQPPVIQHGNGTES